MEMLGRRALWEVGLNYGHGTGHGVGNYFGVHECASDIFLNSFVIYTHFTYVDNHFSHLNAL